MKGLKLQIFGILLVAIGVAGIFFNSAASHEEISFMVVGLILAFIGVLV